MLCIGFDIYNMAETERVSKTLNSIACDSDHVPVVIYTEKNMKCLNPWDVQSKHIMTPECVSEALCSGEKDGEVFRQMCVMR